jgi:transposase
MTETLTIISERVDDIPLLLVQLERMGVPVLVDAHFPTHGNWVGLSLGWVTVVWLTHILSQADHRLSHVEPWAEQPLHTLGCCTGQPVHPLDLSDARLAVVLEALRADDRWAAFEGALPQQVWRVYALPPERVRLDSTTASGDWRVTEDGLCQFGPRQDQRPDLPQVTVMVSALDPLGWPVATDVVPGQRADDPLYIPAIARVRQSLGRGGRRSVGDGKMGTLETRAFIQAGGDYYLCPLSELQVPAAVLERAVAPVWPGQQPLPRIDRRAANGKRVLVAEGDERLEPLTAPVAGQPITWTERRLVVRSRQLAQAGERGLRARLTKAQAAVAALTDRRRGKRRLTQLPTRQEAVEASVRRYQVQGVLHVCYDEHLRERPVRRYGSRPATVRVEREAPVRACVAQEAVAAAVRRLGWRVYATTQPAAQLSLGQAVVADRREYLRERNMGRLKGRPLALTPMVLARDDHATGVIRLLSLGLRVLTLLEFVVRRRLATGRTALAGLYAGNPKRATARPTAERLLESVRGLTLTRIREGRRHRSHLTPLSALQQRSLALLDFPIDIYTPLWADFRKPPYT